MREQIAVRHGIVSHVISSRILRCGLVVTSAPPELHAHRRRRRRPARRSGSAPRSAVDLEHDQAVAVLVGDDHPLPVGSMLKFRGVLTPSPWWPTSFSFPSGSIANAAMLSCPRLEP